MTAQEYNEAYFPQFPQSYWLTSTEIPKFPKLSENIKVDVAIVGAGMTGITTAYMLMNKGYQVAIVDAGEIMHGTTGHTTAKITAQHDLIYDEYHAHFGLEKTKLFYEANMEALAFIRSTVEQQQIDCQFMEQDAFIYAVTDPYVKKLAAEYETYEKIGVSGSYVDQIPLPIDIKGAVVMNNQAVFNPVPFLMHLVQQIVEGGGQIFGHTTVTGVEKAQPSSVSTQDGHTIACNYVVVASHYPFNDRNGFYFTRLHTERSYAMAVKTQKPYPGGMYLSAEQPKRSLRPLLVHGEPMVIVSGEGHKTGQGDCTFDHYEALKQFGEATFGLQEIAYRWSAQDVYTLDNLPYIGQELKNVPNILIATGYRKWGMTSSVVAAMLNTRLIAGEKSPYEPLYSPMRFQADPAIKSFVSQNADVAKHLLAGKLEWSFKKPTELNNDEGAILRVNGKRTGAYRDQLGELHLVDTTCSHMGCEVQWNAAERSYDCPCHGSRFTYRGEVMEGPAKKALGTVLPE